MLNLALLGVAAVIGCYLGYSYIRMNRLSGDDPDQKGSKWWIFAMSIFMPLRMSLNFFSRFVIYPVFFVFKFISDMLYIAYSAHIDVGNEFLVNCLGKFYGKELRTAYQEKDGILTPVILEKGVEVDQETTKIDQ